MGAQARLVLYPSYNTDLVAAGATLVTNDGTLLDGTVPGLTVENWKV